jgi:hypothetical protein
MYRLLTCKEIFGGYEMKEGASLYPYSIGYTILTLLSMPSLTGLLYYYLVITKPLFNNDFGSVPSILLLVVFILFCIFIIYRHFHEGFVICDDRLIQIVMFLEITIMYDEIVAIEEVDNGGTWLILKHQGKSLGATDSEGVRELMPELRKRLELYGIDHEGMTKRTHIPWYLR